MPRGVSAASAPRSLDALPPFARALPHDARRALARLLFQVHHRFVGNVFLSGSRVGPLRAGRGHASDEVLLGTLASTGHRGRVDARGRRVGRSPGLTRTGGRARRRSCRDRGGRDLRSRWARRSSIDTRRNRHAQSARAVGDAGRRRVFVDHDKERRRAGPPVRVRPAGARGRWPRASTRPRWPVDAKLPPKDRGCFFLTCQGVACGEVGGGLIRRRTDASRASWRDAVGAGRTTQAGTGRIFTERLSEPGRAGRVQTQVRRRSNPPPTSSLACPRPARSAPLDQREAGGAPRKSAMSLFSSRRVARRARCTVFRPRRAS